MAASSGRAWSGRTAVQVGQTWAGVLEHGQHQAVSACLAGAFADKGCLLVESENVPFQLPAALVARLIESEESETAALIGRTIHHYEIIQLLGKGGMGEVYLATDTRAGRNALLKVLPSCFTADAERIRRFQQEARTVVALNHPNIVTIYEIG